MSEQLKTKIRLLKEWTNDGITWPEGELLKVTEAGAECLIKQGIAEIYEPKGDDVIVAGPLNPKDSDTVKGNITYEDLEKIIADTVAKSAAVNAVNRPLAAAMDDEYTKTGGFSNMWHFARDVYKAGPSMNRSESLNKWHQHCKASGLSEGVDVDGGFLVPTEFRSTLLRNALEASIVRQRATVIPMVTSSIKIPIVQETSRASSVFGGVIIYRPNEAGQKTGSKPKFGQIELNLKKLVGLCYATDELLEDSPISMQPLLTQMFSAAIAFQEDEDFINGTGAGQALGVMNSPCLVTVSKESGQSAGTIVTNNITKIWSRLAPASQGTAIWLANSDTFPQLATLTIAVGSGGSVVGLLNVNTNGVAGAPFMTLLGRPLILTEHCQTLGITGDIILADWRQYLIGQKVGQALKIDTSIHLKFDYDETAFRFVLRYDGQPWWPSPLSPKHGSNDLSPFVALETRS